MLAQLSNQGMRCKFLLVEGILILWHRFSWGLLHRLWEEEAKAATFLILGQLLITLIMLAFLSVIFPLKFWTTGDLVDDKW